MATKNRTLIKLDDEIVEIVHGKKGLKARKLTTDELVEVSLLDEGVEKLIENDINKLTNQAYAELQQGFKNHLKANVLKIAGFEDRWGNGYEVDHCNGRTSTITNYISSKVQQMISTEIDKLITPTDLEVILKDTKKGLLKDIQERFTRAANEEIYKQTQEAAKTFIAGAVKKSMTKYQRDAIAKAEIAFLGRTARPAEDEE